MTRVALAAALGFLSAGLTRSDDPVAATRERLRAAKLEAATRPRAPAIAREAFLQRPSIVDVQLAPDGRVVSFQRRGTQGADLMVQDVASGAETRIVAGLRSARVMWSGDGRRLWVDDEDGLAVMESPALKAKRIVKWNAGTRQRLWAVDPRVPQYAIIHERVVSGNARHAVERHRYLTVDALGKTRLLIATDLPLRSALLNAVGDLAFTAGFEGPRFETVVRRHTTAGSPELLRCGTIEACMLIGYDQVQQSLWILSQNGEDKYALRRWRTQSGRWETMHRDPGALADADAVLWDTAQENWLAIAYHGAHRRWYGRSRETTDVLSALERLLPGANLQLTATVDRARWLVQAQQSDRASDRYYIYGAREKQLRPVFTRGDSASSRSPRFAVMRPVTYRASDGMLLHGYVLLPSGVRADSAPLVAWLHGGPVSRVYDGYEPSMQLLVNRGCAVFVPNFRVSAGYGQQYTRAAHGDVGKGRVLADIVDGLNFLLAEGIGNRSRQAVMGMSFGGYASLLALSHHPARFRFAVAAAPPTDYGWIKQWQAEHEREAMRPEGPGLSLQFPLYGFRYQDADWREKMQRESPLAAIPSLQAPAYIWAGAVDERVPLKSIVNYVGHARRLGKSVSLLVDPRAGHVPESALGAEAYLYLIERAAHRHFGSALGSVSPTLQAFLRSNLRIDVDARPSIVPR